MRTEFIYSLAALSAIPVVANADAEAYKADKVQTVGTASDVELAVGTLAKGNYTVTSAAISGADLYVKVMAGETQIARGKTENGKEISLNFFAENQLTDVKIVLEHTDKTVTVPAPVVTLKFDFALVANKLQIEHNKLTQALAGYEYPEKTTENTAAVGYYDRIMAIAAADYKFYVKNTEGVQDLYADQSKVTGMALFGEITDTYDTAKNNEKAYQEKTLGGGNGLLGQYDKTYLELKTKYGVDYVTDALTNAKTAAWDAYDTYIKDVTNFDNRTTAKNAIAAYKTVLDAVVTVKNDNEGANTELNEALNSVYGAANSYYDQTKDAIETNYAGDRYAELKGELTTALEAIVKGTDKTNVVAAINAAYTHKTAMANKNTLINMIATFKQKITQTVSDFNALKDQLAAAYTTYDEQKASADELIKNAPDDLGEEKLAVLAAVQSLEDFIKANDTANGEEHNISKLTDEAIATYVNNISAKKVAYSDQKAKYDKYTAVKASVDDKQTALNDAVTAADTYAKTTKKLNGFNPSDIWASTINAINQEIGNLLNAVKANEWTAAEFETKKEFKDAMAKIQTDIDNFATNAQTATDLYATIAGQVATAGTEKAKTLAISGIDQLNVWTSQVTTDEAIKARTPYNTVINTTIKGHITDWTDKLLTAVQKKGQYNPDPKAEGYTNNILGYLLDELKSLGGDASKVLADDIATLKAIQLNYQKDEEAFLAQVDQQQIAGMKTMINTKAEEFEPLIAALQTQIDKGDFGKIKGGLLKTEIDAISQKINDAKAVAAKQDATYAEVTAAYNAIKNLDNTDIAVAQTNANTYADAFKAFTTNYNILNGNKEDSQDAGTVYGLKAKVKAQKDAIDAYGNLTNDQKTALKAKVDAVQVVKEEGDPAVEVTYTIATIDEFIKEAWQNEQLTDEEVAKYQGEQGIISGLKAATNIVALQAGRLNVLEGNLATINFNAAKTAILAKDPNPEGFFVVDKLLGNEKAGQCTFDFNKIKSDIEADENITEDEKTSYNTQINTLNGVINGLPAAAEFNLNKLNDAKKAYSDNKPEEIEKQGAVQRYENYVAILKAERQTTALEGQLATLATLKEALDKLMADAEAHYAAGTASATDKDNIDAKALEIKGKFDEYYNEVNYNAQIAADNKAQHDLIKDAKATVQGTYDVAASVINTYKNFKSEELQSATAQAQAELQNLLDYLVGYDALVSGDNGIQTRADAAYNAVVSPEKFDGTPYIAEYQDVNEQITNLKKALTDKIEPLFKDAVNNSVVSYSGAINTSKTKVAKFSATDEDLTEAQLNALYATIDNLLKAINDVKDDADKLKELDAALVAAANAENGIKARITNREQTQATSALTEIIGKISINNFDKWGSSDQNLYNNIGYWINNNPADCVTNFSTYKKNLNDIKARAAQVDIDQQNIKAATTAINTANDDYKDLAAYYNTVAAGVAVKVEVETIQTELQAISGDVTKDNAVEWKEKAVKISKEEIPTVYNNLFDAEVVVIEGTDGNGGLIAKAREENITYSGDKAAMTTQINTQAEGLGVAKAAVEKEPGTAGYKTKEEALADLKNIESAMNGIIKVITDANGTNLNDVVKEDLNNRKNTLQTNLDNSLKVLNGYTIPAALSTKKANIQTSINNLNDYIGTHTDEMVAYQENALAMITDIDDAIKALKDDAQTEKNNQDKQAADAAIANLNNTWNEAQGLIDTAQGQFETMGSELEAYGATTTYANKVKQLKTQIENADGILTAAKAEAEGKETTAEKQDIATKAKDDVNNALAGVANNCDDIITMAKQAYIDAFIAGLNAQMIADTWTNSSNYTATDKETLTNEREDLKQSVDDLKNNAQQCGQAEDIQTNPVNKGVITTLNEGAEKFATDLAQLKQDLKDMSLAEDVKGHIVPGKDEIDTDDMEALADIILNGEEAGCATSWYTANGPTHRLLLLLHFIRSAMVVLITSQWRLQQMATSHVLQSTSPTRRNSNTSS